MKPFPPAPLNLHTAAPWRITFLISFLTSLPGFIFQHSFADDGVPLAISIPSVASPTERLAAREVRRYFYLRTGQLLPIATLAERAPSGEQSGIALGTKAQLAALKQLEPAIRRRAAELPAESYLVKTINRANGTKLVLLAGGDDIGVLYAAYRFAEHLGARFYLHGDVLPDAKISPRLPELDEMRKPLFRLRGIQPFHDFPEGPDWWNRDDYLAIVSQLPKLGMNFIGLHTYPEGKPNAEPTVWIGLPGELSSDGKILASYPSSYQNTRRGNWGYLPKKTSAFSFGAAQLFAADDFGADVMNSALPQPNTPDLSNAVFERTSEMLRAAFDLAHQLGVKTCVGTETPLTIPKQLLHRIQTAGKNPNSIGVTRELYEGIFQRAAKAYPIDYYWLWTPENWTWSGASTSEISATINDIQAAIHAAKKTSAPFQLATCGWVLGPPSDRALFDKTLPKEIAISCINREVGRTPVEKGFADVSGRSKWAIPWLEDDPGLTSPQLWAGRMRRDAADALQYGCDGLMGIHWRTRVLGPAVSALAQAAWDQSNWSPRRQDDEPNRAALHQPAPSVAAAIGGQSASFPNNEIAGTESPAVYQTVRYNLSGYRVPLPNGSYSVTLQFCEPHYAAAGRRVFHASLQGRRVIENLDIFARVGSNRALDFTFDSVAVTNGLLAIDFNPVVEFPAIAAVAIVSPNASIRFNCGGPAVDEYQADLPVIPISDPPCPRVDDFYADWAAHEFGNEIGQPAGALFARIDGRLPRPSDWIDGPGGIKPDPRPWAEVEKQFQFVHDFAAWQSKVAGVGNRSRFDYWLNTFRNLEAIARLNCAWAEYNRAAEKVRKEKDPNQLAREMALPSRRALVSAVAEMCQTLLATVSNAGELGTIANWEQHNFPELLDKPGKELSTWLGEPLPADAQPATSYHGPLRVIVPTVRSSFASGESLALRVLILSTSAVNNATISWRPLGTGAFQKTELKQVARGVFVAHFPAEATRHSDLEYYVTIANGSHETARFPAAAPELNATLVSLE